MNIHLMNSRVSALPYFLHNEIQIETRSLECRFITTVGPSSTVEEAHSFRQKISNSMPGATHHVYAYIIGLTSPLTAWSDDGEPKGTAGRPVFVVLENSGLTNLTIVVSRYFGGVLLGSGGLVRAYSNATRQVLKELFSCSQSD